MTAIPQNQESFDLLDRRVARAWDELISLSSEFSEEDHRRWLFRGLGRSCWSLCSTLDRALERFGVSSAEAYLWELRLTREFQRHAGRFTSTPPADDIVAWLGLMQHHGAPTRLLDWTYSFWVAVFFAIRDASPGDECAIWAMNTAWFAPRIHEKYPGTAKALRRFDPNALRPLFDPDRAEPFIAVLAPYELNERLAIQQGTFVTAADIRRSFMENLTATATGAESEMRANLLKICVPCSQEFLRATLSQLHRMNVNETTLFPGGIDGFSRDLRTRVSIPELFHGVNGNLWSHMVQGSDLSA